MQIFCRLGPGGVYGGHVFQFLSAFRAQRLWVFLLFDRSSVEGAMSYRVIFHPDVRIRFVIKQVCLLRYGRHKNELIFESCTETDREVAAVANIGGVDFPQRRVKPGGFYSLMGLFPARMAAM